MGAGGSKEAQPRPERYAQSRKAEIEEGAPTATTTTTTHTTEAGTPAPTPGEPYTFQPRASKGRSMLVVGRQGSTASRMDAAVDRYKARARGETVHSDGSDADAAL